MTSGSAVRAVLVTALVALVASVPAACSLAVSTDGLAGEPPSEAATQETSNDRDAADARDTSDAADAAEARVLPDGAKIWSGNGHAYLIVIVSAGVAWDEAHTLAEKAGGHLATVGSAAENDFVTGLVRQHFGDAFNADGVGPWLGGYQPAQGGPGEPTGGWQWVDGTPWTFTQWDVGQPDNTGGTENYLDFYRPEQLSWNDEMIRGTLHVPISYLVEYD